VRYLNADPDASVARISRIGLGTWQFGSREWGYGSSYAGQEAHAGLEDRHLSDLAPGHHEVSERDLLGHVGAHPLGEQATLPHLGEKNDVGFPGIVCQRMRAKGVDLCAVAQQQFRSMPPGIERRVRRRRNKKYLGHRSWMILTSVANKPTVRNCPCVMRTWNFWRVWRNASTAQKEDLILEASSLSLHQLLIDMDQNLLNPGHSATKIYSRRTVLCSTGSLLALASLRARAWAEDRRTRVVLILSGVINDGGWGQLAFEGLKNEDIAQRLQCERHGIGTWRRRWQNAFQRLTVLECLEKPPVLRDAIAEILGDLPRAGCGGKFTAEQIAQIIAVACEPPDKSERPVSHWTPRELADEVIKRGIVTSISVRHVGRFLKDGGASAPQKSLLAQRQSQRRGCLRAASA